MKKRLVSMLLAAALLMTSGLSLAENRPNDAVWDAYTPYDEPVEFTKGVTKGSENFPDGMDYEHNIYTDFVAEQINVHTKIAWEVDGNNLAQKIALSIANGEIPDMMVVDRKTFNQLLENELIWDMTDAYESCISPFLKAQYDTYGDVLFNEVRANGRMMGIPATNIGYCHNVLWIRKDWLDKLGRDVPSTLDEVIDLARAFIEEDPDGNGIDDTIGLTANETLYSGYNNRFGLDTIFATFGAYPGSWVMQDGQPVYGSVMPGMKEALAFIRDLYAEGILDKEFAIRKGEDRDALLASGKMGMHFGVWWPAGGVTAATENNHDADWIAVSAPVNAQGKLTTPTNDPLAAIVVVSKEFQHPEAIVKALNVEYDSLRGNGEAGAAHYADWTAKYAGIGWGIMPIGVAIDYNDAVGRIMEDLENALAADDVNVMQSKGFEYSYSQIKKQLANPREDSSAYMEYLARIVGAGAAMDDNVEFVESAYFGQTESMATKWAHLQKLEQETMIQIVMGEKSIDEFDAFVEQWYAMGGQEITDEIIAARAER